jgi:hypothetical protein
VHVRLAGVVVVPWPPGSSFAAAAAAGAAVQAQERLEKLAPIPDHSAEVQELLGQQQELREQVWATWGGGSWWERVVGGGFGGGEDGEKMAVLTRENGCVYEGGLGWLLVQATSCAVLCCDRLWGWFSLLPAWSRTRLGPTACPGAPHAHAQVSFLHAIMDSWTACCWCLTTLVTRVLLLLLLCVCVCYVCVCVCVCVCVIPPDHGR